ncbi:thiamine-phosphate kinase [Citromicrobium bathyomarinum]
MSSGEIAFIDGLRNLATHPAARGLTDDAAVLEIGGETLILTKDVMVEGVHWPPQQSLADVAWKLVAVNLSDLAAKGAEPVGVMLGYALGADDYAFLDGLRAALDAFDVPLLGGDTVSGGDSRTFSLTAIGRATHTPVPSRAGARPREGIYLCGSVGGAMMGFESLTGIGQADQTPFTRPTPLLTEGRALSPHATAMMDVSDGLLLDAWRMAQASKVTLSIDSAAVPIAAPESRRDDAIRWGDDYALLFTAPTDAALPADASLIGLVDEAGDTPLTLDGKALSDPQGLGYRH